MSEEFNYILILKLTLLGCRKYVLQFQLWISSLYQVCHYLHFCLFAYYDSLDTESRLDVAEITAKQRQWLIEDLEKVSFFIQHPRLVNMLLTI